MITGTAGLGGLAGWRLLQRTADQQIARLAADPVVQREQQAFMNRMAASPDADSLVGDYRSLKVALTAFGLEADLANKAFVRKVLTSDPGDQASLANRLADKRYRNMSETFGFGTPFGPPAGTAEAISDRFLEREFERRIGESDNDLRLALYAQRELGAIAASDASEDTKWYGILGSAPLAQVVRGALGLPESLAKAPVDQQVAALRDAASRQLGIKGPSGLADPQVLERLIDRFVIRSSSATSAATPYDTALTLLQGVAIKPPFRFY